MRAILYIFIGLVLVGCRAKKKTVARERERVTEVSHIEKQTTKNSTAVVDSLATGSRQTMVISNTSEIELKRGEGDTLVEVTERQIDGGRVLTISGAGSIVIKEGSTVAQSKDTTSVKTSKSAYKSETTSETENTTKTSKKSSRNTDSRARGVSWAIVVGLGVTAFLLFLYWRTRRRK